MVVALAAGVPENDLAAKLNTHCSQRQKTWTSGRTGGALASRSRAMEWQEGGLELEVIVLDV